jgi:hypothetical protein
LTSINHRNEASTWVDKSSTEDPVTAIARLIECRVQEPTISVFD